MVICAACAAQNKAKAHTTSRAIIEL